MSQKNLKNIIRKLVQEYTGTGDAASTGLTSDDGNNVTSPRIGGSYRDDYEEILAYTLKSIYGGDGGHYSKDGNGIINHNSLNHQGMFELKNYVKQVLEELDEDAYGSATLTTQGQRKKRFKTPHGGPPGMWVEKLNEDQSKIADNNRKMAQNNIDNSYLALKNQELQIKTQRSQLQKNLQDQTKQLAAATAAEAEIAKKLLDLRKEKRLIDATIGQLQRDQEKEGIDFPPENITYLEDLVSQSFDLSKSIKQTKDELKKADNAEQSALKSKSQQSGAASRSIAAASRSLAKARRTQKKQVASMRKQLREEYFKSRKDKNLMEYMDSYKREILLEKATSKFFSLFDEGKTDEEILRLYAEQGVVVPEQFLTKLRKKHEGLKHDKLDLEEFEREAKNFKKAPLIDEDEIELDVKKLSSRLFKENKIKKKYSMPSEIRSTLLNDLEINPINRYVKSLKAINSIPPSYRIFLNNDQFFDIVYEDYSLMIKIGPDDYYLGDLGGANHAKKHINRLLTKPTLKKGDIEDEEELDMPMPGLSKPASSKPSPPPPPKEKRPSKMDQITAPPTPPTTPEPEEPEA